MFEYKIKRVKMGRKEKLSRRGVSAIIGYVLLVAFAVGMGGLIYNWMKTYVPKDAYKCPDGVSMFVSEIECIDSTLNLKFKNNGRFGIAGYYIRGAEQGQEIATIDLSSRIDPVTGKLYRTTGVMFRTQQGLETNSFEPGDDELGVFNLGGEIDISDKVKSLEIIPFRFEAIENKFQIVSCTDAKIKEFVECGEEICTPDCTGKNCGDDGCGGSCGSCSVGKSCSGGICIVSTI